MGGGGGGGGLHLVGSDKQPSRRVVATGGTPRVGSIVVVVSVVVVVAVEIPLTHDTAVVFPHA